MKVKEILIDKNNGNTEFVMDDGSTITTCLNAFVVHEHQKKAKKEKNE